MIATVTASVSDAKTCLSSENGPTGSYGRSSIASLPSKCCDDNQTND